MKGFTLFDRLFVATALAASLVAVDAGVAAATPSAGVARSAIHGVGPRRAGSATLPTLAIVPTFTQIATDLGPAPLTQELHLVLHLAYPNPALVASFVQGVNDPTSMYYGKFLTPTQFTDAFSPPLKGPKGYSQVEYVVRNPPYNLQVLHTYANRKIMDVLATVAEAQLLFGTVIHQYSYNNVVYYANNVPAIAPDVLANTLVTVTGLNDFVHKVAQPPSLPSPLVPPYSPVQLETAYDEPLHQNPSHTAAGTTVAIESAFNYTTADLSSFLKTYNIVRAIPVSNVYVQDPLPFSIPIPNANQETTLDVEQVAGSDLAGNVLVYEASDPLDTTFDDLYEATVDDPRIDVVTTSWGGCEAGDDPNELAAENDLFMQAAAEGQTRVAASGDNGAFDCGKNSPPYGLPGSSNPVTVDFPASSPYVAGVGGSTLSVNSRSGYGSEAAWPGSGGGVSALFPLPFYQSGVRTLANSTYRNVPDVALSADPSRPYAFFYNGSLTSIAGTSAAAPNFAVTFAQIASNYKRRIGLAQPVLYDALSGQTQYASLALHDITSGNNGAYSAGPGYDNVTGVGSVNGYWLMRSVPATANPTPL